MPESAEFQFTPEQTRDRCEKILELRDKCLADPEDSMARLNLHVWSWEIAPILAEFWLKEHGGEDAGN